MSGNIKCNIKSKILKHELFALQVDKSTDITGKAHLLIFARFINDKAIVEDFLGCKELPETANGQDVFDFLNSYLEYCGLNWKNCVDICTDGDPAMIGCLKGFVPIAQKQNANINGQDVFDFLNSYLEYCGLNWKNCVDICTDGDPAMIGCLKGFVPIAQKQNANIVHTHCFIHREALVAKTLGTELKSELDMVVKIVNYIKMRPLKRRLFTKLCADMEAEHSTLIQHTEMRWLSRGKVLSRFYKLREELLIFCLQENLKEFVECLSHDHWRSKLAYLTDIFHELNLLNSGMQGRNEIILSSTDKINAFQKKVTI